MNREIRALDFVRTPGGNIAIVTETSVVQGVLKIAISYIGPWGGERNAWWKESELEVIDSLPSLLARTICHPFGDGEIKAKEHFGIIP